MGLVCAKNASEKFSRLGTFKESPYNQCMNLGNAILQNEKWWKVACWAPTNKREIWLRTTRIKSSWMFSDEICLLFNLLLILCSILSIPTGRYWPWVRRKSAMINHIMWIPWIPLGMLSVPCLQCNNMEYVGVCAYILNRCNYVCDMYI